jgi:2-methylcitrate dehydratase
MGYELGGRFQKILGRRLPWDHTTGTGLMAPAIAGRLMGLDEQRLACALGFAMAHCLTPGSVRRGRLSAGKFLADPINARTSVFLTRMAANGVTGPVEIFEGGSTGLSEAAFPGVDFSALFAPVAKHYMIEAAALKAYPSASTSQAAITAALKVRDRLDVSSDQIDRVEVTMIDTPDVLGQISDRNRRYPTNQETADHSFHFLIAVALIDGELTFRQYGNRRWDDPRVKALMNVITVTPDKRWRERRASPFPAAIKVVTRDGREAIQEVPYALGDPHNRFSRADLVGKFTSCVVGVLDSDECQHIISTVMSLESQASISALSSRMRSN